MGSIERLDNAMLRKETAKACEKMGVEFILKTGTNTDRILPLAQDWSRSTHELLIISLDGLETALLSQSMCTWWM
jgi:hypothetical protein